MVKREEAYWLVDWPVCGGFDRFDRRVEMCLVVGENSVNGGIIGKGSTCWLIPPATFRLFSCSDHPGFCPKGADGRAQRAPQGVGPALAGECQGCGSSQSGEGRKIPPTFCMKPSVLLFFVFFVVVGGGFFCLDITVGCCIPWSRSRRPVLFPACR